MLFLNLGSIEGRYIIDGAEVCKDGYEETVSTSGIARYRWNCTPTSHLHFRCKYSIYTAVFHSKEGEILEKKNNGRNRSNPVLYEFVQGLDDLLNVESSDIEALSSP